MKPSQFIIIIIAISSAWASLFITVLNQSSKTNQLLRNDNTLLSQQKQTLASIQANARTRSTQLNDLQAHIDCLFNLATQPNHSSAYIANASACTISSTTSTPGASAPAASPQPSKVFVSAPSAQTAPNSGNKQMNNPPKPVKSTICKLTLGLLC